MSAPVFAAVGVCVVGTLIALWQHWFGEKRVPLKDGQCLVRPARLPFVGIAWGLTMDNFLDRVEELLAQYGPFIEIYIGSKCITIVSDATCAKEVLSARPKHFRRQRLFDDPARRIGALRNLFFASGAVWSTARKFAAPSFNKQNVQVHAASIFHLAKRWTARLRESGVADGKTAFELKNESLAFTLSVITKTGFGINDSDAQSYFNTAQFPLDLQAFFAYLVHAAIFPAPLWLFRCSPMHRKLEDAVLDADTRISPACLEVIQRRKRALQEDGCVAENTLLDTLLRKQDGEAFSEQDVLENVKAFYLAGSETTSISIAWAVFFLAQHAEAMQRVRDEAKALFAVAAQRELEMNDVQAALRFTEAVLKETLRLRSPASLLDNELEDGVDSFALSNGLVVRRDAAVFAWLDGVMRGEKFFENAKSFVPARWLDEDVEKRERCEANLMCFGFGPRVCPGQRLAMLEGTIAIAALAHDFDFALGCEPEEIHRLAQFTSVPDKMPVIFTPVQQ